MRILTYVFPAASVAFLFLLVSEWLPSLRRAPLGPPEDSRRWERFDSAAVLALTLVYAAVAFLGLGNTHGVQSFCKFTSRGQYALIELRQPTEIGAIRYFAGLHMGSYYVQFSMDWENFTDVGTLEQKHADIFKWRDAELQEDRPAQARYLRLIADSELWLGELAVYDTEGRLLTGEDMRWPAGCDALFDEQEEIPAEYDYMNSTYFDEIYHARTAYEHLENIYPYEISHPPLGKLILSLGIALFGLTPFGWRFSGTLIGVAMVPVMYIFLKRMFGGRRVPLCLSAVFAFDFMHYVQTRIATIDSYAVFFILLMYLFFWEYLRSDRTRYSSFLAPLLLSGLCFGLGAASKWICFYAGAGLGILWLLDRILRGISLRKEGKTRDYVRETVENLLWCILGFVLIPGLVYYLSYTPYGLACGMKAPEMYLSEKYLRIVTENQAYMFRYHSGVSSSHPYSSVWWQWLLDIRPILYYLQYPREGVHVSFACWVNPMLCWGGLAAMLSMVWLAVRHRDKTALFLLIAYLAQLLPWVFITRPVFEYHYFPSTVFLLLVLGHLFRQSELLDPKRKWPLRSFTAVALLLFLLFYPALRGLPVSGSFGSRFLKWFPSWPL